MLLPWFVAHVVFPLPSGTEIRYYYFSFHSEFPSSVWFPLLFCFWFCFFLYCILHHFSYSVLCKHTPMQIIPSPQSSLWLPLYSHMFCTGLSLLISVVAGPVLVVFMIARHPSAITSRKLWKDTGLLCTRPWNYIHNWATERGPGERKREWE